MGPTNVPAQSNKEPPADNSDEESLDDGWSTPNMGDSTDTRPSAETLAGEFAPLIDALPFCDAGTIQFAGIVRENVMREVHLEEMMKGQAQPLSGVKWGEKGNPTISHYPCAKGEC